MTTRRTAPLLVLGLMLIPTAVLTWLLVAEKDRGLELAQREKRGLGLSLAVARSVRLTALHRGLSFAYLSGDRTLGARVADAEARVEQALAEVDSVAAQHGWPAGVPTGWGEARESWRALRASTAALDAGESFARHTALIENLLGVLRSLLESSGLLFESQPDSHFLIDTALVRLPDVLEELGQLRGRGAPQFSTRVPTDDDRLFVSTRIARIRTQVVALGSSVRSASRFNPALRPKLREVDEAFQTALAPLLSAAETGIVRGQRGHTPEEFFALGTAAIDAGMRYAGIAEEAVQALLEARVARLRTSKSLALGTSAVLVGSMFLIAALVVRSTIAQEAMRQAREELEHRVQERTRELKRSNELLARSNAELEQFAYVASHDLQEPLRMVGSYVQLLERRYQGRLDADAHEFIAFAVDGAKRMQALINDLLSYSRIGTKDRPFQPTDCEAALATAMGNLRMAVEESGARVTHGPLPTVMGDATQLAQLFQNLLANAIKFRGDLPPEVCVRAAPADSVWRFSVQDNGIGIAREHFERVFVLFQRLHGRGAYPGTGIGLAICKKVVERHGGRIWVESEPGGGSTFHFTVPRDQEHVP